MRKAYLSNYARAVFKQSLPAFTAMLLHLSVSAQQTLVITEIMANPAAVADTKGEWFEVYNYGSATVTLNKAWLSSGSTQERLDSLRPLQVPPGSYFVFGVNDTTAINGDVKVDYVFKKISLANATDDIALADSNGVLFDRVSYSTTKAGKSWSLAASHLNPQENDAEANWCFSVTPYNTTDFGTPGIVNDCDKITTDIAYENQTASLFALQDRKLLLHTSSTSITYLLDSNGKVLSHLEPEKETDLNSYPAGLYFIKALIEGKNKTFKIVLR